MGRSSTGRRDMLGFILGIPFWTGVVVGVIVTLIVTAIF